MDVAIIDYAKDWAREKAGGYLRTGIQAGGTMAGNAVGGVGSVIENGGRSFGEGTVTGGIQGVGNYINGYGDSIRGSMAADGPVKNAQKKAPGTPRDGSAKKSPTAQKVPSSAGGAREALPAAGVNAPKALPGPSPKASSPKSTPQAAKPGSTSGPSKPTGAPKPSKPVPDGKVRISPESRPKHTAGKTSKPPGAKAQPNPQPNASAGSKPAARPLTNGKVRISPESRPKSSPKR